jgi:hypothetical protein
MQGPAQECRVDLGPGSGVYILFLRYGVAAIVVVLAAYVVRDLASALFVAGLGVLLTPVARLAWRQALALQGMQAIVTVEEVRLTLPTWGSWPGPSLPLVNVAVDRADIEAVEVDRDPAGFGLARKADLVMKIGNHVPLWRLSEGWRKQWIWQPGEGWREDTAAIRVRTGPAGVSLSFRLMGGLIGFAERLAAALGVPCHNRLVP